jgi:SAM-dependent methyltransferase
MEANQNSFYWIARNKTISWLVTKYFPETRRILDIGCGTGYVTRAIGTALPNAAIYATDIYIEGIRSAASKIGDRAFFIHLDATDIPFTASFDLITSFDVLEHIPDDQRVLEQMHAALRPGGGVLHFVPQHPLLFSPADNQSHHVRRYARRELQCKLEQAGFDVVDTMSFMFFLLPLFAASRFRSKLRGSHNVGGEHQQPAAIAGFLGLVQNLELFLLRRGWRFPVGVSRAVVARRR